MTDVPISIQAPGLAHRVSLLQTLPAVQYTRQPPRRLWYCDRTAREQNDIHYTQLQAQLPEQSLYLLFDADVRGKGVITLDGCMLRDNLEGVPLDRLRSQIAQEAPGDARVIEEPVFYALRYGVKNYGHCLTDILPRMIWFHQNHPGIRMAVHQHMPAPLFDVLQSFGIRQQHLLTIGDEHLRVRQLYFMDLWNRHPLVHAPRSFEYLRQLRQSLPPPGWRQTFKRWPTRLFVTREDATTRSAVNHDAVERVLRARGYTPLSCGKLSLHDQIRHFSAAEAVVGISGAALTNTVFCEPGVPVVNLAPTSMPSSYFWDIAHHAGLPYSAGYFTALQPHKGIHSDLSIDLDGLEQLLAD